MLKKYALMLLVIPILMVGCNKKEEEKKEYVIGKDVSMFMDVTEESEYDEVVEIMEEAEQKGFGEFEVIGEDAGELRFIFDVVNKEAAEVYEAEEYLYKASGMEQQMYLEGHPVFESSYSGATIFVGYAENRNYEKKITDISYWPEDDNEKMSNIEYSFKQNRIVSAMGVSHSNKFEEMKENSSKKEVDEFIIKLTN